MIKTVTYFPTLLRYAREEYDAIESGDKERIKNATKAHEEYRQLCLKSPMVTSLTRFDLDDK